MYLLLIVEPRGQRDGRTEEEGRGLYDAMVAFGDGLKAQNKLLASNSLKTDASGVRVQVKNGAPRIVDGPFAESKEMVGGFFLLDCDSRDEAIAIASRCPAAQWATVEVREVGPCFLK